MSSQLRSEWPRDLVDNWPTRGQADAILAALDRNQAGTWTELEQLSGVPDVAAVADRCFRVYGHRQLEGWRIVQRINEVEATRGKARPLTTTTETTTQPAPVTYGLQPRRN